MKSRLLLLAALAALPVAAFAQVELIAGYNFGQYIGFGLPSTDGLNGTAVGFIRSNYTQNSAPGPTNSGIYNVANGIEQPYFAGSSTLYYNGLNSSDAWDFVNASDVFVLERNQLVAINHNLVNGLQIFAGDDNNAGLRFTSGVNTDFSIVTDTRNWMDFNPASFEQPNDFNLTFSAYAFSGSSATLEWIFDGVVIGSATINPGEFQAFNIDLPETYYGDEFSTLVGRVTGQLVLDHVQINGTAIPEPSTFAALAGVSGLALAATRRRRA
jgi:hypothetical protein